MSIDVGWGLLIIGIVGMLSFLAVLGTVLFALYDRTRRAPENQQDTHRNRIADGDDVHPDDADSGSDL